eukprot:TRINITY_DN7942_c0_g2_i1.p1 TRINITY_DN7942_c0_g2~~TRINITY_DN7942_c0_g2_i1.p1  ORF type:complete len:691 (-),score=148.96 TRINITY_DN7942_c0_g2_i1:132-2204(-)
MDSLWGLVSDAFCQDNAGRQPDVEMLNAGAQAPISAPGHPGYPGGQPGYPGGQPCYPAGFQQLPPPGMLSPSDGSWYGPASLGPTPGFQARGGAWGPPGAGPPGATQSMQPAGAPAGRESRQSRPPFQRQATASREHLKPQTQSMFENPFEWWLGPGRVRPNEDFTLGRGSSMFEPGLGEQERATKAWEASVKKEQSRRRRGLQEGTLQDAQLVVNPLKGKHQGLRKPSKGTFVDEQDAQIGLGFAQQLKRGVAQAEAQAEEAPKRAEMVPQKDGGFIATIQKGFEGLFGHLASSKEEVLKMRGPMPALEYEAVPGDDIDAKVQYFAQWLPEKIGGSLMIYRKAKGEYEIAGEEVFLRWHQWIRPDGVHCREVFAVDANADFSAPNNLAANPHNKGVFEPLPLYLLHSAGVAHNLKTGNAVTQVPELARLSFADVQGTNLIEAGSEERFTAMAMALKQAELREKHAQDYRKRTGSDETADAGPASGVESMGKSRGGGSVSSSSGFSRGEVSTTGAGKTASEVTGSTGLPPVHESQSPRPDVGSDLLRQRMQQNVHRKSMERLPPPGQLPNQFMPPHAQQPGPPRPGLQAPNLRASFSPAGLGPGPANMMAQAALQFQPPPGHPPGPFPPHMAGQQPMFAPPGMPPRQMPPGPFAPGHLQPQAGSFFGQPGSFYGQAALTQPPHMPVGFVR